MSKLIVSWNECINIKDIIELNFEQVLGINDNAGENIDHGMIIDSILSNIPTTIFILFKLRNRLYTNQYSLVEYLKLFLNNKIKIEESNYYLNNISGMTYKDFSLHQQENILNYLVNCIILDLNNCEEEKIPKIINRYCI